jgi:hypothetical protein
MGKMMKSFPEITTRLQREGVQYFDGRTLDNAASDIAHAFMKQMEDGTAPAINTAKDLANWLHGNATEATSGWNTREAFKRLAVTEWEKLVLAGVGFMGAQYEDECEIQVRDKTLKVPKGSLLYVLAGSGYPIKNEDVIGANLPALEAHYGRVFIVGSTSSARARSSWKVATKAIERKRSKGYI